MENDVLIEEIRQLRKTLLFACWSLATLLAIRPTSGPREQQSIVLDLSSPEGRQTVLDASRPFSAIVKVLMDEYGPSGAAKKPPSWLM